MSAQATAISEPHSGLFPSVSGPQGVAARLAACVRALQAHMRVLRKNPPSDKAAEWLLDNYSFLQSQIRGVRKNLRPAHVAKLMSACRSHPGPEPRIYQVAAIEVARATDAFTGENLLALADALRSQRSLKLCELWAFGTMLKLALLESLCAGLESELVVSSCIESLHLFESLSWQDFVESVSAIEDVLRRDPARVYPHMDFETRDRYRRQIVTLASRSKLTELEVAEAALTSAQSALARSDAGDTEGHVGYYLIGAGAPDFARSLGCKPSLRSAASHIVEKCPGLLYASSFLIVAALIVAAFDRLAGPLPFWIIALLLVPASQMALDIVNSVVCHFLEPRPLPSMNFTDGIPDSCRTMVVVPSLLLSPRVAARLMENLEIRYLANRDPNLLFALLTDFPDAGQPETPADSVLDACVNGIARLNARYGTGEDGPFYLFHRARQWNPKESKWMGPERKRGKLNDLNRLLLGGENSFDVVIGDRTRFAQIRYIITLDADTQLPRDTAAKLIAGMAHPLNRPVVNPVTRTVTQGYGLMRPRVSVTMESAGRSLFAQVFSGMAGFDPYATAVSDVYQDFFGLTSFTGKGIYDLRAFDAAVGNRFPDNAILSHDLIEGEHVRGGFLPSVELMEDYPATYQAFCKRKHRWVRGDWQLLPWLLLPPRPAVAHVVRNPLGLLSRWKIFDNLRRSLTEITLLALLLAGWTVGSQPIRWTLIVLALLQLPAYADILLSLFHAPRRNFWSVFVPDLAVRFVRGHRDTLLTLVFLPHQACLMADAIARTLWRRLITQRNLLEWETMAQSEGPSGFGIVEVYLYLSAAGALLLLFVSASVNAAMCLVAELWIIAPLIAWWLNQPPGRSPALSEADRAFLRETALRTWRYFADYSDREHHWLIPDNVQLDPPLPAHRISPTNLGLQLTAQLAAHDFGYLTHEELLAALRRIVDSMAELPRYRGHFYNWYDTGTLAPLTPRYVSSVDSGNLAASLCTVRHGLLDLRKQPWLGPHIIAGLRDHALRLREQLPAGLRSIAIMRLVASLLRQLECQPTDLFFWEGALTEINAIIARIHEGVTHACAKHAGEHSDPRWDELKYWNDLLAGRIGAILAELYTLAPWLAPEFESELRVTVRDASLTALMAELSSVPVLSELPRKYERIRERLIERLASSQPLYPALRDILWRLLQRLTHANAAALDTLGRLDEISADALRYFDEMDFGFLHHKGRNLLRIGYNVSADRPDEACYDLLASEARTAVFLAIAKGDLSREAWFKLGRRLTMYRNHRTLISWSGTMFEYLMPQLHFRMHENTLLGRAVRSAVRIQQAYAREHKVPWGISEAAYAARDHLQQYQYRAFGVPALSLQPDHSHALVIAPYASMLALPLDARQATANLRWLAALGCLGRHGFFDSIDYSVPAGQSAELVRSHMAHHQGMGLIAIDNTLLDGRMQERFHLDTRVQATEFLLEERMSAMAELIPQSETQAAA